MPDESAVAEQSQTETEKPVTETAVQDSSVETTAAEQETGAQQGDEQESTYQLPDEQSRVWSDEQLLAFAQNRYAKYAHLLADPNTPDLAKEAMQQFLHDKLNGDIYIQKLREQSEQGPDDEEEEESEDAPIVDADPTRIQEHWNQAVTQFVDRVTDPKVAQTFTDNFTKAFDIKDPQQRAMAVTKTLSGAAVNLMRDAVPELLFAPGRDGKTLIDRYLEQRYEGLSGMVKTQSYGQAWNELRQSDPKFANVPAYNTAEWNEAIAQVAEMVPGFENAVFTDKSGKILSPYQNFVEKSRIAIKLMSGQAASPKLVADTKKAVETGKKVEREATRSRANANLGAGQSRGQISTQAGDPLKEAIAKYRAESMSGIDLSKVVTQGPGVR
jgi:hypothetical protein